MSTIRLLFNNRSVKGVPGFSAKLAVRDAAVASGLEYTFVTSSLFAEFVLTPLVGVNVAEAKITFPVRFVALFSAGFGF